MIEVTTNSSINTMLPEIHNFFIEKFPWYLK